MKKTIAKALLSAAFIFAVFVTPVHAQSSKEATASYKNFVGENPTDDADIKTAGDFVNALIAGNLDKAKSLMADGYIGYGPGSTDSANKQQTLDEWKQNNITQTNRNVSFVPVTYNVKTGDLKGHWVALWGDYSFTQNGKDVKFPFHYVAKVNNGKVEGDRIYYDQFSVLKALGYTITPPAK